MNQPSDNQEEQDTSAPDSGDLPEEGSLPGATASYDPADNKIRIRCGRVDRELYDRIKAAGFARAFKQELFVAPMWTPEREDLAIELCGELGDEDTSLVDRAEERAERFADYRANRAADAESAHAAVHAIADHIPLGQPILVGHHSERRARRDAEKIQTGMRRAVKMWETSKYWERRARGVLNNVAMKEDRGVRARRIKGLEADRRKQAKNLAEAEMWIRVWGKVMATEDQAAQLAAAKRIVGAHGVYLPESEKERCRDYSVWGALEKGTITVQEARDFSIPVAERQKARAERWIAHLDHRLTYEKTLLGEAGGVVTDRHDLTVGGQVLVADRFNRAEVWLTVVRVNKGAGGAIASVRAGGGGTRGRIFGVEEVKDYRAPEAGAAEKVAKAVKLPPLVNEESEGCVTWTKADWERRKGSGMASVQKLSATATHAACRRREGMVSGGSWKTVAVFVSDMPRVSRPLLAAVQEEPARLPEVEIERVREPRPRVAPEVTVYDAMRESLKTGVAVVVVPQLFVTPDALADRVVEAAEIARHHRVLEPSAGTGQLVRAVERQYEGRGMVPHVTAIEIDQRLVDAHQVSKWLCADFLAVEPSAFPLFDRCVMNSPFADQADIDHVRHAAEFLSEGGILVAIMSAGVKFRGDRKAVAFRAFVGAWGGSIEDLPEGSFTSSGTGVRAVLVKIVRPS